MEKLTWKPDVNRGISRQPFQDPLPYTALKASRVTDTHMPQPDRLSKTTLTLPLVFRSSYQYMGKYNRFWSHDSVLAWIPINIYTYGVFNSELSELSAAIEIKSFHLRSLPNASHSPPYSKR